MPESRSTASRMRPATATPRTTRRYDRARGALDNHAAYAVATYFT
jgi:hypothetical protein